MDYLTCIPKYRRGFEPGATIETQVAMHHPHTSRLVLHVDHGDGDTEVTGYHRLGMMADKGQSSLDLHTLPRISV